MRESGRNLLQLTVLWVSSGREECVAKHNVVNALGRGVVQHVGVDKEEDGQIDFFSREQFLFFKAEALYFGKEGGDLSPSQSPCQSVVYVLDASVNVSSKSIRRRERKVEVELTLSGETLYVAMPIMSRSLLFLAV